jgi:hypothetical protein
MTSFDEKSFFRDFKYCPGKAVASLIKYLEGARSPVDLPRDLFLTPSPFKLLAVDPKLLGRLDQLLTQKGKDPQNLFFVQAIGECQRVYSALDDFLKELDFEELLIYCGYFYERRRFQSGITMYDDPNVIDVISTVLDRKIRLEKKNKQPLSGSDSCEAFDGRSFQLLQRISSEVKLQNRILKTFGKVDHANHLAHLVEWTLQLDLNVSREKKGMYRLSPADEKKVRDWKVTDLKYKAREHYYLNLSGQDPDIDKIEDQILSSNTDLYTKEASIRMWSNQYRFFKERFPERIQFADGSGFESLHFFNLVNSLSQRANSRWNHLMEGLMVSGIDVHAAMLSIIENGHAGNDTTHVFSHHHSDLLETLRKDFNKEEARTILNYLTHDLHGQNGKEKPVKLDLNLAPILKIGKILYWFPGIIANKDYGAVLQNKLQLADIREKGQSNFSFQSWTEGASQHVADLFRRSGFEHIAVEQKYKSGPDYKGSDIDLAVYEDGYLFLFEIKFTYGRSSVKEIRQHTLQQGRSIQKAFDQIQNHFAYLSIPENLDALLQRMDVLERPEVIEIIPVILDNTFEMDGGHELNGRSVYKISDLELEVMLKDNRALLLDQNKIMEWGLRLTDELSLRSGSRCRLVDMLDCIRERRVWKDILNTNRVGVEQREIRSGRLSVKYTS